MRYLRWLQEPQFDHPAHRTSGDGRSSQNIERNVLHGLKLRLKSSFQPRLSALWCVPCRRWRGVELIIAVTFTTEVGDARRFANPVPVLRQSLTLRSAPEARSSTSKIAERSAARSPGATGHPR